MDELNQTVLPRARRRKVHYRGRLSQISFILGKLLRMFVYQNDWKVLPMAALIAALVSMVVKNDFFLTMEGSLKGALALTCVAIWNGCFNSIQVICRERSIIKREHRSGMHISSYIVSHMLYQALLCLVQTALTLYVCSRMGVQFPREGFLTRYFMIDLGITVFLITYASDMLSLWVSCLAHSTTAAMTVMPFLLIFQLVFSGGIFSLPAWCQSLSNFTISKYGITCVAAQADYNNRPMITAWNTVQRLKNKSIAGTVTLGQALDFLSDDSNEIAHKLRTLQIGDADTVGQIWETLRQSESWKEFLSTQVSAATLSALSAETGTAEVQVGPAITVGDVLEQYHLEQLIDLLKDYPIRQSVTLGEAVDFLAANPGVQELRGKGVSVETTVGRLVSIFGEERVKAAITQSAAESSRIAAYERSVDNIVKCWFSFVCFILAFAILSVLSMESIDRDKR